MAIAVAVCDDHAAYARGVARLLEHEAEDIEVVAIATSADEAERAVARLLPDVVLVDIGMRSEDGVEVTRRIQAVSPSTRTLVLTAADERCDLYPALRAGACGYVARDADVAEIVGAIRSIAQRHLVIPAGVAARFGRDLDASHAVVGAEERDVLAAIARGETAREIGLRLGMAERTVRRRVEDLYAKLHVADRVATGPVADGGPGPERRMAARPPRFGSDLVYGAE